MQASADAPLSPPRSAEHEVLSLVARQVGLIPWPVFLAAVLIMSIAMRSHPTWLVMAWLLMVTGVLILRWKLLVPPPDDDRALRPALHKAIALSGLNGVTHALCVLFFPHMTELERSVLTMLLAGLSSGAVGSTSGHTAIYSAYTVPVMGGLALGWAIVPSNAQQGWLGTSMSVLIVMYLLVLMSLARGNYQALQRAVNLRQRAFELNRDLRDALEAAEHANVAKTRFLASASHDLRQPLHTLTLFSASLNNENLSDRAQDIVGHMNTAIRALGEQLSGLLDLSKLDAGIIQTQARVMDLAPLLRQLHHEFTPLAQSKGLRLVLNCPGTLGVHSDEVHLGRIVRNLLDNAIKYCDAGTVWLAAETLLDQDDRPDRVLIRVQDTGRGIPAEHQKQVFEEFFQLDNPERDRTKGLGLGLSIVQRMAQLLDIRVALKSETGVGTQVTLELNAATSPLPPTSVADDADTAVPMCHMLVIDDETEVRAAMKALLTSRGCRVTLAACTDEAIRLAAEDPPDIALVDFRLRAEENGIKAIRKLRQQQPGLPALLVSGDTAPDRLREAQEEGLLLLHKPVSAENLLHAIRLALEEEN
ncbi:ATP-binding protein [Aquabacterium sp.]|uniref:sensor histidine kinase n=1 Tax=Aquabacterium sp. TaxID=1872578 RepID=UPI003D6D91C9